MPSPSKPKSELEKAAREAAVRSRTTVRLDLDLNADALEELAEKYLRELRPGMPETAVVTPTWGSGLLPRLHVSAEWTEPPRGT